MRRSSRIAVILVVGYVLFQVVAWTLLVPFAYGVVIPRLLFILEHGG